MREFTGTLALLRFALRRDRILLPAWIAVFAGMAAMSASATVGLYPEESQRIAAAETVNASTALVALYGPLYDPTSIGALSLFKMTAFGAALAAVLMLFVVVRHTRGEEESGRLELMSAGGIGRQAPLAAALLLVAGASLLLAVGSASALIAAGLAVSGSFAFGLGWGFTGLAFGAVAAVCAQITTGARTARGLALVIVAISYAVRAIGDVSQGTWLTWLSPLGWMQQIRAYAGDRWWVLLLPLALAAVCVPLALVLRSRRDLGAGLITDRPGPAHGSMGSAHALAWRLQRPVLIAWVVAFAVFGALLGSLSDIATGFLDSAQAAEFLRQLGGAQALVDAFLGTELSFMGIIAAGYGISAALRLHTEEAAGHTEVLLAQPVGRLRWAVSHIVVAAVGIVLVLLAGGVGLGVGATVALGEPERFGALAVAALARVPAAWVLAAVAVLLFGWLPRWAPAVWGVFVVALVLGEFGPLWEAPQWLMDLSAFVHTPRLPGPDVSVAALVPLTVVAAVLVAAGLVGWRRRDLT